jgi:hypothetical protein
MILLLDNQPVILTVWTSPEGGTSITAFKEEINGLMTDLGGGYQLTEIDLSQYTKVK